MTRRLTHSSRARVFDSAGIRRELAPGGGTGRLRHRGQRRWHHQRPDCAYRPAARLGRVRGWNDPGGSRTRDLRIKSPLLYQLSYRVSTSAYQSAISSSQTPSNQHESVKQRNGAQDVSIS